MFNKISFVLLAATAGLIAASPLMAQNMFGPTQVDSANQGQPTLTPQGGKGAFIYDAASGTYSIRLAPWNAGNSRGPTIPYSIVFTQGAPSVQFDSQWTEYPYSYAFQVVASGTWAEGKPAISPSFAQYLGTDVNGNPDECDEWGPYIFTDFDGSNHDLGIIHNLDYSQGPGANGDGFGPGYGPLCPNNESDVSRALDNNGISAELEPNTNQIQWVKRSNGDTYYFNYDTASCSGDQFCLAKIEDSNGNIVTVSESEYAETWTDAAGRTALILSYNNQYHLGIPQTVETFDSNGNPQTYSFSYGSMSGSGATGFTLNGECQPTGVWCVISPQNGSPAGDDTLVWLTLPDGTAYKFTFDNAYVRVDYPTGGYEQLNHGVSRLGQVTSSCTGSGCYRFLVDSIVVASKTEYDGMNTATTNYTYSPNSANGTWQTTITDPMGYITTENFGQLWQVSSVGSIAERQIAMQSIKADSSGNPLRVVTNAYGAGGWIPFAVQTALCDMGGCSSGDTPLTQEVDPAYDPSWTKPMGGKTYDYANCPVPQGPAYSFNCRGGLLKQDQYTFLATNPVNGVDYTGGYGYGGGNFYMTDLPLTETITDGSGTMLSQTTWQYDSYVQPSLSNASQIPGGGIPHQLSTSGATQHDAAYSSAQTVRGNPTSVSRWVSGGNSVTSYAVYDDAGNRTMVVDPLGYPTVYSFADAWNYSNCAPASGYAASFTNSVTNALNQTTSFTWNSCSGTIASKTDPNNQTTKFWYQDSGTLDRLTEIDDPDVGWTLYEYTDSPGAFEVQAIRLIDATGRRNSKTDLFDGLGRPSVSAVVNDEPDATGSFDRVDTCYDLDSRVSFKSYPYWDSMGSLAPRCSGIGDQFQYDALSRPTVTTHSDGTTKISSYLGRATETQDEGTTNPNLRITHISQLDGLGNLVSVCEATHTQQQGINGAPSACNQDDNAMGFLTTYSYNALGKLLQVTQGSEVRSFQYDGLSRLTSATNPESGTTTYTFDNDSNVLTRTRPAPNQNGSSNVTTSYTWDALNRLLNTSYSDSGATPGVNFTYDTAPSQHSCPADAYSSSDYAIGRMSSSATTAGVWQVFCYDPSGRVVDNTQYQPAGSVMTMPYTWDYVGDQLTQPEGLVNGHGDQVGWEVAYNKALRPIYLGALNYSGEPTAASSDSPALYNAGGAPTATTLGNGLTETLVYDTTVTKRQWLNTITVAGNHTNAYTLSLGHEPDGDISAANDSVNGNWTYTFDDFNRLVGASCSGNNINLGYTTSNGDTAFLQLAASGSSAPYTITSVTGSRDGQTVTGLSTFAGANNLFSPTAPYNGYQGLSYTAGSISANFYTESYGMFECTTPYCGSPYNFSVTATVVQGLCTGNQSQLNLNWTYDRYGNRWTQAVTAGSAPVWNQSFSGSNNRIDSGGGYNYDAAGNVTYDGTHNYVFDAENRIVSVDSGSATYTYNAAGQRVGQIGGGHNYWYALDLAGQKVATMDAAVNNTWHGSDLYFDGRHLGYYDHDNDLGAGHTWQYYSHADWLGTERVRTDQNGNVAELCQSLPFGDDLGCVEQSPSSDASPDHFTGKPHDAETGLDYFGARYNSPSIGRFMTVDDGSDQHPTDPQSWNLYSYVRNNPVNLTDPTGHWVQNLAQSQSWEGVADGGNCTINGVGSECSWVADWAGPTTIDREMAQQQSASGSGMTTTITNADGSQEVRTGNRPWRDNNPGDITMSPKDKDPFAARHGAIGSEGGFAIFPNAQTGFSALSALLSTDSYQSRSILDAMNRFAPASDNNNPTAYAATLGQAVGAPVSTKLSSLSSQQMGALVDKIAHVEGFYHAGTIRMIPAP